MSGKSQDLDTMLDSQEDRYPRVVLATRKLLDRGPMFRGVVRDMMNAHGDTFFRRGEERVREIEFLCNDDPERMGDAVMAYVRFCMEFARKQVTFLKTGKYAFDHFDRMCEELYDDDDAVRDYYLFALLFSFVFSPNYYEFYDFFEADFLSHVPENATVVEVGCGHGVYLSRTLLATETATGVGLDIAPAALGVAKRILEFYRISSTRYSLRTADVRNRLEMESGCATALICCELLEHLPDPRHALRELRRLLDDGGVLMLSAAIRMESVDHLYVFRSHREVVDLVNEAGLSIETYRAVPLAKGDMKDSALRERLLNDPRVPVGFICRATPL